MSVLITFIALYYLVSIFSGKTEDLEFSTVLTKIQDKLWIFLLCFVLMPINWLLETLKWKRIISEFQNLNYSQGLKSILLGISLALITPNGVGEYGGRIAAIDKGYRKKALFMNAFLSVSQLTITVLVGIFSVIYFLKSLVLVSPNVGLILLIFAILLILVIFKYYFTHQFQGKILLFKKIKSPPAIPFRLRVYSLVMSFYRYLIFTTQFFLLLYIFIGQVDLIQFLIGTASIFFISAIIPTGWISILAVRTSLAFFVFEMLGFSGEAAVLASTFLWLINLFVPAMIGLFYLPSISWSNFSFKRND